jgi:hypothetical protein
LNEEALSFLEVERQIDREDVFELSKEKSIGMKVCPSDQPNVSIRNPL